MGTKGSAFTHNSSDTVHDLTCAILTCAILQQQLRTTCPKVFRLLVAEYQIGYYLRIRSKSFRINAQFPLGCASVRFREGPGAWLGLRPFVRQSCSATVCRSLRDS